MDDSTLVSFAVWIVFGQAILALGLYLEWRRRHPREKPVSENRPPRMHGPDESAGSE